MGLSSSTQLRPACRAQRSSSTGGEPCPRPASAILTIGKGEPADFRAHISAHRHLATSACGLGAALLRRQCSWSCTLSKHPERVQNLSCAWMQLLALMHALTLVAFPLYASCPEWAIVSLIEEVLSGQRRAADACG